MGSGKISIIAIAAAGTVEGMATASGQPAASGAGARAIPGLNIENDNATLQGFVFDELLELSKGPRVMDVPFFLSSSQPISDVGQLFHHNDITLPKAVYNLSADVMVNPADYSALLARKPFQELLCSSRAFRLKSRS